MTTTVHHQNEHGRLNNSVIDPTYNNTKYSSIQRKQLRFRRAAKVRRRSHVENKISAVVANTADSTTSNLNCNRHAGSQAVAVHASKNNQDTKIFPSAKPADLTQQRRTEITHTTQNRDLGKLVKTHLSQVMLSPRKRRAASAAKLSQIKETAAVNAKLESQFNLLQANLDQVSSSVQSLSESLESTRNETRQVVNTMYVMSLSFAGILCSSFAIDHVVIGNGTTKLVLGTVISLAGAYVVRRLLAHPMDNNLPRSSASIVPHAQQDFTLKSEPSKHSQKLIGDVPFRSNEVTVPPKGGGLLLSKPIVRNEVDGWVIKTEKELKAVQELRSRLQDLDSKTWLSLNLGDSCIIRFLRARKMDLDAAEAMYRDAHNWFAEKDPEKLASNFEPNPVLKRYFTGGICGVDRDGCPVLYDPVGQVDPQGILKHVPCDQVIDYEIWKEEATTKRFLEFSTTTREHYQHVVVLDLQGLSRRHWHQPGLQLFQKISFIGDNRYPERLKAILIVNAPRIFWALWVVVKHFFDATTREKIQIFSSAPTDVMSKYIEPEQIPRYLGGKMQVNGNPYCSPPIKRGGRVPDKNPLQ